MLGVEQAFGWGQFKNVDVVIQVPPVGFGALAQLALSLREGDIQRSLAVFRSGLEEMQRHGGLASARFAFEQEQVAT